MKKEIENYIYIEGITQIVEDLVKENNEIKVQLVKSKKALKRLNIVVTFILIYAVIISIIGFFL